MRDGLRDALRFTPVPVAEQGVAWPKDSIVVCYSCGKPLYRLQASIYVGEKPSRSAWKYAPVTPAELYALAERSDLDPGVRAAIKLLSAEDLRLHCDRIQSLKTGDWLDCPACQKPFVFVRTSNGADGVLEFTDRAYVIQLATIPPVGQARPLTLAGRRP